MQILIALRGLINMLYLVINTDLIKAIRGILIKDLNPNSTRPRTGIAGNREEIIGTCICVGSGTFKGRYLALAG